MDRIIKITLGLFLAILVMTISICRVYRLCHQCIPVNQDEFLFLCTEYHD